MERELFQIRKRSPVKYGITSPGTLQQTKGNEIGSLKTKTLINGSGRFSVIKCSQNLARVIDYKTMERR